MQKQYWHLPQKTGPVYFHSETGRRKTKNMRFGVQRPFHSLSSLTLPYLNGVEGDTALALNHAQKPCFVVLSAIRNLKVREKGTHVTRPAHFSSPFVFSAMIENISSTLSESMLNMACVRLSARRHLTCMRLVEPFYPKIAVLFFSPKERNRCMVSTWDT